MPWRSKTVGEPGPIPSTKRPAHTSSRVAAVTAVSTAPRVKGLMTAVAIRAVRVAVATAEVVVMASRVKRVSVSQIDS